jgi:uncharacterized Zn finger protein (UPF0148 family)
MTICEVCQTPLETKGSRTFCPACMLRGLMEEPDVEAETADHRGSGGG